MNEWETQAGIHDIYEQIFSLDGTAVCKQHIRLCPLARIDYALYTPAKMFEFHCFQFIPVLATTFVLSIRK